MTETESKIVQLLKSDEDYNKILGLMLGRNELGVEELFNLFISLNLPSKICNRLNIDKFEFVVFRNNKEVVIFNNDPDNKQYDDYIGYKYLYQVIPTFKRFLKLTIDDNI